MSNVLASVKAHNEADILKTTLQAEAFSLVADEPLVYGGQDLGPSPADYLCMALASCQAITLRLYARRKAWSLDAIDVKVDFIKAADAPSGNNSFYVEIALKGNMDAEQRARLLEIAKACPIHRLLGKPVEVITKLQ